MALPPINKNNLVSMLATAAPLQPMVLLAVDDLKVEHHTHINSFLMAMQDTGFSASFDWQEEFKDRREDLESLEVLQNADLEELRKIMIAHVRIDRMSNGHLESLITSGYWAAAIARAEELTNEM